MKRWMAMLVALVLLAAGAMAEENWYAAEGQRMAERVQTLAGDEVYCQLYYTANESMDAMRKAIAAQDYSKPVSAKLFPLPGQDETVKTIKMLNAMLGQTGDSDVLAMSDVGVEEMVKRIPASLVTMLTAKSGTEWVALQSVLTTGETCAEPENYRDAVLFLEYPGEYAVAVVFQRSIEGCVGVTARPVPKDGMLDAAKEYFDVFREAGLDIRMEELPLD